MRRRRTLLRTRAPVAVLGRPWFLGSLALLLLNDHLLKARFPGPVTGKLSDVAGPVVVAALAALVVGRTAGVAAVTVAFTALKTVPGVAEAAQPILGGLTRRDPTDLLGLLALPFAWHALGRHDGNAHRPRPGFAAPVPAPLPSLAWIRRHVVPVGGAAFALVALTATSSADPMEVRSLAASDAALYAELGHRDSDSADRTLAISDDGGRTWEEHDGPLPADVRRSTDEVCRTDGHCFAARGATIESKAPGRGWAEAYGFDATQRELLDYRRSDGAPLDEIFASAVVAPSPDGEVVVVAARDEGVVVLDPDGSWERVGVLGVQATSASGTMWPLDLTTVLLFASLPVALLAVVVRSVTRGGGGWKVAGSIAGALLVAVATWTFGVGVWALGTYTAQNPVVLALVLGVLAAAVVFLPWAFVRQVDLATARESAATADPPG